MNHTTFNRDLRLMFLATLMFGAANGIFMASLNNYLADIHHLNAQYRGFLELPREFPGFMLIVVSSLLTRFVRETQMAAIAMVLTAAGAVGLGFAPAGTITLVGFIILWSLGDHMIFALEGVIGLKLSNKNATGRRLGQLGGAKNLGIIIGMGAMLLLDHQFGNRYDMFYGVAALFATMAGLAYMTLKVGKGEAPARRFVIKKKYGIYYAISALFGVRKQIFLAFGAWVLVKIHGVEVSVIATLYFIASVLGVIFRPLLGDVIDWFGEKRVLATDELLLLLICLTYAFAGDLFSRRVAINVLYGAFILDSVLFALRIARTTYLKKIADHTSDITPTVAMGVTIDHAVAMTLPIVSGYIWDVYGFRWVFHLAAVIAVIGFFICLKIRVPEQNTPSPVI